MADAKECPQCGIMMTYDTHDKIYSCLDPACGYYEEDEEDENNEEDESDEDFRCPYCGKVIEDNQLPD